MFVSLLCIISQTEGDQRISEIMKRVEERDRKLRGTPSNLLMRIITFYNFMHAISLNSLCSLTLFEVVILLIFLKVLVKNQ